MVCTTWFAVTQVKNSTSVMLVLQHHLWTKCYLIVVKPSYQCYSCKWLGTLCGATMIEHSYLVCKIVSMNCLLFLYINVQWSLQMYGPSVFMFWFIHFDGVEIWWSNLFWNSDPVCNSFFVEILISFFCQLWCLIVGGMQCIELFICWRSWWLSMI